MKKKFYIHTKGNYSTLVQDYVFLNKEIVDYKIGYGYLEFKGTEQELDKMLEYFREQGDGNLKVLGVFEDDPVQEEYYKNLLTN
jgi:hypothetical protein